MLVGQYNSGLGGLAGASPTGTLITSAVGTAGRIATPAIATAISSAAWAVPVVGAAVAGVTLALSAWFNRRGPQQRIESTRIVDELEPHLAANRDAFLSGPRTRSSQQVALANFDSAWAWLISEQACGNPALGNPGQACIADRQRSGRWPWEVYYRDPIRDATGIIDDPVVNTIESLLPGVLGPGDAENLQGLLIPAALIIAGLLL